VAGSGRSLGTGQLERLDAAAQFWTVNPPFRVFPLVFKKPRKLRESPEPSDRCAGGLKHPHERGQARRRGEIKRSALDSGTRTHSF